MSNHYFRQNQADKIGKPLTAEMSRCQNYTRSCGGTLHRFPGGYWRRKEGGGGSFSTSTVHALVRRGLATYTRHQSGVNGVFPVEITLSK